MKISKCVLWVGRVYIPLVLTFQDISLTSGLPGDLQIPIDRRSSDFGFGRHCDLAALSLKTVKQLRLGGKRWAFC